jgi:hypothetical protein
MSLQTLTYYPSSKTVILYDNINENSTSTTYTNISFVTSASAFNALISGSDFGATVASIRYEIYSGSTLIAAFPYESTNYVLQYQDFQPFPTTSFSGVIQYYTSINGVDVNSNYYLQLSSSNISSPSSTVGLVPEGFFSIFTIYTGSIYNIVLYSGDGSYNNLYINNISGSPIFASTSSFSSSYNLIATQSFYAITASISYSAV